MANYLVRVELHSANGPDYETLHQKMVAKGFLRTILSRDSLLYKLPTAEYTVSSSLTVEEVRDHARAAANDTGKNSDVLAVEYLGSAWYLSKA